MPEPENEGRVRDQLNAVKKELAELKAAVTYLLKGAKNVEEEIESEWGETCYGPGEHLGIRIN